jgi:uncharacterized membrane protein
MTRRSLTTVIALTAVLVGVLGALAAPALAAPPPIRVVAGPTLVSTRLGDELTVTTRVTNRGSASSGSLLAHLNIASVDRRAYVDPEDWSSERSQELTLSSGESRTLSWDIQAVNSGSFAAYVVVLPTASTRASSQELVVSPMIRLEVATRSTLDAGGALYVVAIVPLVLGVTALAARWRLRRQR